MTELLLVVAAPFWVGLALVAPKWGFASEPPDLDAAENLILCWSEVYRLQESLQFKACASKEDHALPADVHEDSPPPTIAPRPRHVCDGPTGEPRILVQEYFHEALWRVRAPGRGYRHGHPKMAFLYLHPVGARPQCLHHESSGHRIPDFNHHSLGLESYLSYPRPWSPVLDPEDDEGTASISSLLVASTSDLVTGPSLRLTRILEGTCLPWDGGV